MIILYIYVTRYDPLSNSKNGRILQGNTNTLFGHWSNIAGVSNMNGWLNDPNKDGLKDILNKSWIYMIEQPKKL